MGSHATTLRRVSLFIALGVWSVLVISGTFVMLGYAATPGAHARAPLTWPSDSAIEPIDGHYTLLFFAHPKCPCTEASLNELVRILTVARMPVDVHAIFTLPEDKDDTWAHDTLLERTRAVPGMIIHVDRHADESLRFDVATSGHVLLYEPAGRLVFSGGITASRGHEGDNNGSQAVLEYLSGLRPERDRAPVFGCPLFGDARSIDACPEGSSCPP